MNLDHLRTFIEVMRTGSFSEVAKMLDISQPAVSFQIQKLEHDLGMRLIDRKQKKLVLTEAGKRLMQFSQNVQAERESMMTDLDQLREEVIGDLVVAASTIPGDYILPILLSDFKKQHPAVQIHVAAGDSGRVIDDVEAGTYDIGFCGIAPVESDLEVVRIGGDEIVLIVYPGHPFAGRKSVSVADIIKEPLINREETSGTQRTVMAMMEHSGLDTSNWNPSLILGTTEAVVSAVESQLGIAFVSNLAIKNSLSLGLVKVVKIDGLSIKRDFFCIYRKQRVVSRLLEEFIAFIGKTAA